jgi:cytochrome c
MRWPIMIAGLYVAVGLAGCGPAEQKTAASPPPAASTPAPSAPAAAPSPPAATLDPAIATALAALPAPYNAADYANGRKVFAQCRTCHTVAKGGPNQVGPNLHGLFGRKAGTAEKFNYSTAVKTSGIVWDAEKLDKWLTAPREFLPGNRMAFAGVRKENDRRDLIGYLKIETAAAE